LNTVQYWLNGSPSDRWNQLLTDAVLAAGQNGNRGNRALALLNVASYDALVAAWDAKYTYNRPRPSQADATLTTAVPVPDSPSYPSEHAVVAGAASVILSYLFPDDAARYNTLAEQAGQATVQAGLQYPSDVQAGLDLGRKVAALVIERAKRDHSDAKFTGTMPSGPGVWTGQNPIDPMLGSWTPWVLNSGDQFRPSPPPAYDSDQKKAELAEVQAMAAQRTPQQIEAANYWQFGSGGSRAFQVYNQLATTKIAQYRLDDDPPQAARIYALTSVAAIDATIACWDAKYTYWAMRPVQIDPQLKTVVPTPNHPSYPSAHGCITGAVMDVLAHQFPGDAATFAAYAQQAGDARLWAGIHFRSDVVAGLDLGQKVAGAVNAWGDHDGSAVAAH
jgi:PAP2 superfamily